MLDGNVEKGGIFIEYHKFKGHAQTGDNVDTVICQMTQTLTASSPVRYGT